ncbi:hypothetical protein V565_183870 [Rhizoctonia solani 123E]|uniref:Uncharacterized protein n=1 Tax=Rhizoctonia solani 123E TaxID=1423351 RepID=A0A074RI42_9AGAM|nr:hypothetical protein V565_183870 [Rhizoctonia solani 123E]
MGTGEPSVGPQIAECQRILEKSGLTYKLSTIVTQPCMRSVHPESQQTFESALVWTKKSHQGQETTEKSRG